MKKLTAHQIIDETVEFYEKHPRSIGVGRCLYLGPNGTKCAIGRICYPSNLVEGYLAHRFISELLPKYSGEPAIFYDDLQRLHDYYGYWKETPKGNELTYEGIGYVKVLKTRYPNN